VLGLFTFLENEDKYNKFAVFRLRSCEQNSSKLTVGNGDTGMVLVREETVQSFKLELQPLEMHDRRVLSGELKESEASVSNQQNVQDVRRIFISRQMNRVE